MRYGNAIDRMKAQRRPFTQAAKKAAFKQSKAWRSLRDRETSNWKTVRFAASGLQRPQGLLA